MFFFKAAAAILAALPLAARATLSITAPTNWNTSGSATLTYTGAATDPVFSCELNNGGLLQYGSLAFCNNQSPTAGAINFQLPSVPAGDGYTVTFVAVSNINTVYATSAPFSIGAQYSRLLLQPLLLAPQLRSPRLRPQLLSSLLLRQHQTLRPARSLLHLPPLPRLLPRRSVPLIPALPPLFLRRQVPSVVSSPPGSRWPGCK
ncbi:hypothetical protein BOTBODRAFT_284216 [Botryobasidium botryosum FD-172 SS1]|uniref:Uncharacterized protein n=1 Tax=Botryobasidium botryosum (strain FD-172 SS1) TaxID=930990 RepID=A0A067MLQ3_BOTB1|nr:hypothetical protein BOTBODRAFT_284216 [Botryobasidium botryosum FD-172 SS1]